MLGGLIYLTFNLVLFLISPIQKHSFILRAIKRLYFARTADNFMFYEKPEENYSETSLNSELNHEISKHKIPRLGAVSWIELFFGCSNIKMKKLYQQGKRKIREETNVVNIVSKIRHLDVIMENSLLKAESRKEKVAHTFHNLINLDSDLDEDDYEGG